jgi:23S rRNA (guanosine2251-2'-O)-methyltransferase
MAGQVSSLNVSAAGAVVMFEAARQRRSRKNFPAKDASVINAPRKKKKGLGS